MTAGINRRKFLGSAAAASAALTIVPRHVLGGAGIVAPGDKVPLSPVTAVFAAEYVKAKPWSAEAPLDLSQNTYASAYYGLWSKDVKLEGSTRQFCLYTPKNYFPSCDLLLVVAPNGKKAEQFANESNWMRIAEETGLAVAFFEAKEGGKWNLANPAEDLAYFVSAVNTFNNREIIDFVESSLYMIGYGEGGSMANMLGLNYAVLFAGVVSMGGSDVPKAYLDKAGNEKTIVFSSIQDFKTTLDGYYKKDCVLPIWIVNDGDANKELIAYWKRANQAVDLGLKNDYANIYEQNKFSFSETINNKPISRVWISEMKGAAKKLDYQFSSYAWKNFLSQIRRFCSQANGSLRTSYSLDELKLKKFSVQREEGTRFWQVYLPSYYDGKQAIPLVVSSHGHAHSFNVDVNMTEWWRVAEANNLAVVFAAGRRCARHYKAGCFEWITSGEKLQSELDFYKHVLKSVTETYNIDKTRIYATGHSNGARMTGVLAERMSDVFAAAAPVGGGGSYQTLEEMPKFNGRYIPYWRIVGEFDVGDQRTFDKGTSSYRDIMQRCLANNIDPVNGKVTDLDKGTYTLKTYYGGKDNVPLAQFSIMDKFCHCYEPQYSQMVWNEFFSKYSRGADGTTYYLGNPVK
jgi:poly(3-hydroxybutyrate) depolymerase